MWCRLKFWRSLSDTRSSAQVAFNLCRKGLLPITLAVVGSGVCALGSVFPCQEDEDEVHMKWQSSRSWTRNDGEATVQTWLAKYRRPFEERMSLLVSNSRLFLAAVGVGSEGLILDVDYADDRETRAHRSPSWTRQQMEARANNARMAEVARAQALRVAKVRATLSSDEGWTSNHDAYGFRVLTRGSSAYGEQFALRVEGIVDVPVSDLLVLLHEVDLWKMWVPTFAGMGLGHASFVAEASALRKMLHVVTRLPWPLQDRDLVITAEAVDCRDEFEANAAPIVILLGGPDEVRSSFPVECIRQIPAEGCYKRLDLLDSAIVLTPLEEPGSRADAPYAGTKLQVIMSAKVDMVVPNWLFHLSVNTMSCLVLYSMCSLAERLHQTPAYQARLTHLEQHPFYSQLLPRATATQPGAHGQ